MNFITELSESKDCNTILMIIDRLIKMRYYIVCKADNKGISAEQIAQMYIKYI